MEAYLWLILASMLAVGVLVGFFVGRGKGDTSAPRVKELEEALRIAEQEMQTYRIDVSQHFEKTATLFNQLTNDYRHVYEHLATSSEKLCGDQVAKLKGLTGESMALEDVDQAAEPVSMVEDKTKMSNSESESEKTETAAVTEPVSIDERADEARAIH